MVQLAPNRAKRHIFIIDQIKQSQSHETSLNLDYSLTQKWKSIQMNRCEFADAGSLITLEWLCNEKNCLVSLCVVRGSCWSDVVRGACWSDATEIFISMFKVEFRFTNESSAT